MADYATKAEIQAQATEPTSLSTDASWDDITSAASRVIDRLCGVKDDFFDLNGGSASARTFYGDGTAFLRLDPYAAATAPTVVMATNYDEPTWIEQGVEGCQFLVVNEQLKADTLAEYGSWVNRFKGWPNRVSVAVTAKWGFTAIPLEVKQAAVAMGLHLFRSADAAFVTINDSDISLMAAEVPPQVKLITDQLTAKFSRTAVFV